MLCRKCQDPLPDQTGPGRKRTMCESCSPKDKRDRRVVAIAAPSTRSAADGRMVAATTEALEAAGRLETAEGQLAMYLAELLDSGAGSQTATISREYRLAYAEATKGLTGGSSALDELRKRREERRRGA
jgi:hypothetical protein